MNRAGPALDTDVLIVGGGPVGLSLALQLNRLGVDCVLVERNPGPTSYPKARGCNQRTMELFRRWGIEEPVRARGLPEEAAPFIVAESVAGREYGRGVPEPRDPALSPAWTCTVTQDVVESVLLSAVQAGPRARALLESTFTGLTDEGTHVATVTESAAHGTRVWRSRFVVGADGAASPVREALGVPMCGPETLAVWANDFWRGDLSELPQVRQTMAFIIAPRTADAASTILFTSDEAGRMLSWRAVPIDPAGRAVPESDETAVTRIREQVGIPDLKVELIHRAIWRMSAQVAQSYRQGRVFLAGDAAHRFPPTGGLGMNTGIQDAHNLAWKLALALRGQVGDGLLDSYETERRPVAVSNTDWSVGNNARMAELFAAIRDGNEDRIGFWLDDMANHYHFAGRSLGFSYPAGAVIPDASTAEQLDSRFYRPTDRPGARYPHVWLDRDYRHSTLDWFERRFVLVTGPLGDAWRDAAATAGARLGLDLDLRRLPEPGHGRGVHTGPRGAALVRPDGHVAWRLPWLPRDPATELHDALTTVLSLAG